MLILTHAGMAAVLNSALRAVPFSTRYGLFQNAWTPTHDSVLSDVTPCTFSGYSGLLPAAPWTPSAPFGQREISAAPALTWTRGVGTISNWVVGYYVVDVAMNLLWGEVNPAGSYAMVNVGNIYTVVPAFSVSSRF